MLHQTHSKHIYTGPNELIIPAVVAVLAVLVVLVVAVVICLNVVIVRRRRLKQRFAYVRTNGYIIYN